jgi:RNA polymerase sigma factor (sigma-70 family)
MADRPMHLVLRHIRKLCATQQAGTLADQELVQRYANERDEVAFAALVRRHGRMVQNVCRTILHHHEDAEDAFQATFLVLARRADSIRKQASVSSWLHGVAYRVALKARTELAKRRASEKRAATGLVPCPMEELTWRELRLGLHEELNRLPEHYRAPLLLCYLEGLTQEEAAHALGCLNAEGQANAWTRIPAPAFDPSWLDLDGWFGGYGLCARWDVPCAPGGLDCF